jgi:hypothetical protein
MVEREALLVRGLIEGLLVLSGAAFLFTSWMRTTKNESNMMGRVAAIPRVVLYLAVSWGVFVCLGLAVGLVSSNPLTYLIGDLLRYVRIPVLLLVGLVGIRDQDARLALVWTALAIFFAALVIDVAWALPHMGSPKFRLNTSAAQNAMYLALLAPYAIHYSSHRWGYWVASAALPIATLAIFLSRTRTFAGGLMLILLFVLSESRVHSSCRRFLAIGGIQTLALFVWLWVAGYPLQTAALLWVERLDTLTAAATGTNQQRRAPVTTAQPSQSPPLSPRLTTPSASKAPPPQELVQHPAPAPIPPGADQPSGELRSSGQPEVPRPGSTSQTPPPDTPPPVTVVQPSFDFVSPGTTGSSEPSVPLPILTYSWLQSVVATSNLEEQQISLTPELERMGHLGGSRIMEVQAILTRIRSSPVTLLWGTGLGSLLDTIIMATRTFRGSVHYVHNSYMELVYRLGLGGLIVALAALFVLLRRVKGPTLLSRSATVAFLMHLGLANAFSYLLEGYLVYTFLAIAIGARIQDEQGASATGTAAA